LIVAGLVGTLGAGLAAALGEEGLATVAVGLVLPQPAPSKAMAADAAETRNFDCIVMLLNPLPRTHSPTAQGYDFEIVRVLALRLRIYSGVT
jgi:hypothetical protein